MVCVFCQILKGELPASFIYRDKTVAVFLDIRPINRGHALVVPINHVQGLEVLNPEDGKHIFETAQKIAKAIRASEIPSEGINLFSADGEIAGQEVPHFHLHVIPRTNEDGFKLRFPPEYGKIPERVDLDSSAKMIAEKL